MFANTCTPIYTHPHTPPHILAACTHIQHTHTHAILVCIKTQYVCAPLSLPDLNDLLYINIIIIIIIIILAKSFCPFHLTFR